ncbi:MAG: DUF4783 domain-containing protein [Candidatus Competibacteraceae bacterium]|nr:DUF4783 domain-containing protein [Candidatus Competibacteraceae bacterium]
MKKLLLFILFIVPFSLVWAQDVVQEVSNAIKAGNAKQLATYFHPSVDLTIRQNEGTYSKAQAEQVVQNFFSSNKPTSYKSNHTGSSTDGSRYVIGRMESSTGSFRVYMLLKNISGKELIQTLRFEVSE